ncbi:YSC84-related protein [Paraburkholderia silviterrae]|uniref:Twin-arginine translocation pathway signal protein n=1 Tax=Paraburkholderia silviterrae TaxID=2528715 RepID=A0A4R5LYT4_9BURK|nr:lipid-binding SYLF domain-containing protein [Paraburkholderia silviterrae]TDG17548.1 twin-arginine translocation pathway signal protein [Paraburkholderia silviterrae]
MIQPVHKVTVLALLTLLAACGATQQTSMMDSGASTQTVTQADPTLDADCKAALASLYANTPHTQELGQKAKGILIFPQVVRAGFIAGVAHGAGILYENGKATGSYATTSGTFGMQAGVQTYGYAMFFMTDKELNDVKTNPGFSVGVAPTIVVADQGTARNLNTTTLQSEIYAFIFDQKGLMAGLGLEGSKITKIRDFSPS